MSMIERSLDGMAALGSEIGAMLRRRCVELCGIFLISVAMMGALALASWSVSDPSLSHATDAPVNNLMGWPGAVAADLLMQLLGLAALALILPVAMWGYGLLGHRAAVREGLRVIIWPIGAVLAAAFASCLPRSAHWPLPSGLGGVIGDAILRVPVLLLHLPLRGGSAVLAAIVLGGGALLATAIASGLLWRDADAEEDDDEPEEDLADDGERQPGWFSLGFLIHSVLSLRARLAWLFGRRKRSALPPTDPALRRRIEPRFDETSDDESDEDSLDEEEAAPARVRKPRMPKPRRGSGGYVLPPLELLNPPSKVGRATMSSDILQENAVALEGVLADFGVRGEIINARPGPVVTLYELEPAPGIKSSRVISLADDIARSMSALSARVAVVSGRNAIGIELPNPTRERVYLRELLVAKESTESVAKLPLCLGK